MPKKIQTKIQNIFENLISVLSNFNYQRKPYLLYLSQREKGDEFIIRDNIVKLILMDVLGYERKDFEIEEGIPSGEYDYHISLPNGTPLMLVETKASNVDLAKLDKKKFIGYINDLQSPLGILSNGVLLEVYEKHGKALQLIIRLNLKKVYEEFVKSGAENLLPELLTEIRKLAYITREMQFIDENQLYAEPSILVQETTLSRVLEAIKEALEILKIDVVSQFESLMEESKKYDFSKPLHSKEYTQRKKFDQLKRFYQNYQRWKQLSQINSDKAKEVFCTETLYILLTRILLIRICEDKKITPRKISNGGIQIWRKYAAEIKPDYNKLLKDANDIMEKVYHHLFSEGIFDWYKPDSGLILKVLYLLNPYDFSKVDRDILGKIYERYLDRDERKKLGQFYTPEIVVDYILEAVGYTTKNETEGKKLLDPACGSGGFLVRAVKTLRQRAEGRNLPPAAILQTIRNNIYGFDINPFACHIAESNLLFQVIDLIIQAKKEDKDFVMERFNIYTTDTLKMPEKEPPQGNFFGYERQEFEEEIEVIRDIKLKKGDFAEGFDFVVGNPPYDVINLDKKASEFFKSSIYGRPNLYGLFLHIGNHFLKEKGILGFIVPKTFTTDAYFKNLRNFILRNFRIRNIIQFSQRREIFEGVIQAVAIVIFEKSIKEKQTYKATLGEVYSLEEFQKKNFKRAVIPSTTFLDPDRWGGCIVVSSYPKLYDVFEKMRRNSFTLERSQYKFQTGQIQWDLYKEHLSETKNEDSIPLVKAKSVQRYFFNSEKVWWLKRFKIKEILKDVSIATQRTTADEQPRRIIATAINLEEYAFENGTNYLVGDEDFLFYVLGIFNSALYDLYFRKHNSNTHVSSGELNLLPLREDNKTTQNKIVDLVRKIYDVNSTIDSIRIKVEQFDKFADSEKIPCNRITDTSIVLPKQTPFAKPETRVEKTVFGFRAYISKSSYFECGSEN